MYVPALTQEESTLLEAQRHQASPGRSYSDVISSRGEKRSLNSYGVFLCVINIVRSSGIVTLPYMTSLTGPYLGIAIFVLDALLATLAIYIIQLASELTGARSFPELASLAFGNRGSIYVLNTLLILALFGPVVSNLIIVGDMGAITAQGVNPEADYQIVKVGTIVLATALITKQCLKKTLSRMRVTSVLSVLSILLFLAFLFFRLLETYLASPINGPSKLTEVQTLHPRMNIRMFAAMPSAFMALNCHNNYF